ncbi:MAG: ABC transporter substrate-binding protein, partial [Gemmatimonadales bacterium]
SFAAFSDSILDAVARSNLAGKVSATAEDSSTVRLRFTEPSPEQLYDATYYVRVLPKHVWGAIPTGQWRADTALAHLVGSGPYRIRRWTRGQFVELEADSGASRPPEIRRLVWRFTADPDAALNLLLGHEVDLMETVGAPDRVRRVGGDTSFRLVTYPAAVYGFLAFRLADSTGRAHPVLGDRAVRRALTAAVDRVTLARAFFGPGTRVPPGPMSQLLWIWDDSVRVLPFDSAEAGRALAKAKARRALRPIDILAPATSPTRRQLALAIQEAWRRVGVEATVSVVDFPIFQERLAQGRFDSYIGAYLDEPSARGIGDQWSRSGWGVQNFGRYDNLRFDSLLARANRQPDLSAARRLWREAMDSLNADAPAIFLYALVNVAAVSRRVEDVSINPYSWLSGLPRWGIDRVEGVERDALR